MIRKGTLAPKTCNNCLGTLKKILNDAVEWNKLSRNPAQSVKLLKIPQQKVEIFNQSEILQLLSASERLFPNEFELFVFALNTGCRIGECCGLKWDSVDLNRLIITIESIFDKKLDRIAKRTKGKRARLVPINPEVFDLLVRMKNEQRRTESDLVFSRCDYKKITHKTFQKILKKAGIPNEQKPRRSFHTLRHTFASEYMKNGGSLYQLQHILGHSTSKQTEQYAHFAPEWLKGETDRVSFALKKGEVIPLARAAHQAALS